MGSAEKEQPRPAGASSGGFFAQSTPQTDASFSKASNPAEWKLPSKGAQGFFSDSAAPEIEGDFGKASNPADWDLSGAGGYFDQQSSGQQEASVAERPAPASRPAPSRSPAKQASGASPSGKQERASSAGTASPPFMGSAEKEEPRPAGASSGGFFAQSTPQTDASFSKASNPAQWKLPRKSAQGFFSDSAAPEIEGGFSSASNPADWNLSGARGYFDEQPSGQQEASTAERPAPASQPAPSRIPAKQERASSAGTASPPFMGSAEKEEPRPAGASSGGFFAQSTPQTDASFSKASNPAEWKLPSKSAQGFFSDSAAPEIEGGFSSASNPADWNLSGARGYFDEQSSGQQEVSVAERPAPASRPAPSRSPAKQASGTSPSGKQERASSAGTASPPFMGSAEKEEPRPAGASSGGFFAQSTPQTDASFSKASNPAEWKLPSKGAQGFFSDSAAPEIEGGFSSASNPADWDLSGAGGYFDQQSSG